MLSLKFLGKRIENFPGSSNGRTSGFEPENLRSNRNPGAGREKLNSPKTKNLVKLLKEESKICPVSTMSDLLKMVEKSDKVLVFG